MTLVENVEIDPPVIWGIGLPEDWAALSKAGAVDSCEPSEAAQMIRFRAFRPEDTVLILRPKLLRRETYRRLIDVSEGEGLFQVLGHDPVLLKTDDDIDAFRDTDAKIGKHATVIEATGRRPDYAYTRAQAFAILTLYYQEPRIPPGEVKAKAEEMLGRELPDHWIKMLARKYTGNTKRTPPPGWEKAVMGEDYSKEASGE